MGSPKVIMENFDRWGADEIYLNCIDRGNRGPNLDLLSEIANAGITTPVIYGGGSDRKVQYKQLDMALIGLRLMPAGALHQKK